jgi:hypothetical protein
MTSKKPARRAVLDPTKGGWVVRTRDNYSTTQPSAVAALDFAERLDLAIVAINGWGTGRGQSKARAIAEGFDRVARSADPAATIAPEVITAIRAIRNA